MNRESQTHRPHDVLIDTSWAMVILMALLFACCAFLLTWSVRNLLFDSVSHDAPSRLDASGCAIVAIYGLVFAYSFPPKSVKVAFLLMGSNYARLAIGYFYPPAIQQNTAAIIGSIAQQIAFAIFLFAIAQWFKSVVRRSPPGDPGGGDSQPHA